MRFRLPSVPSSASIHSAADDEDMDADEGTDGNLNDHDGTRSKYNEIRMNILNPKCVSMGELYGEFNELTQEWADGLASSLLRVAVEDESEDVKWIVFDGPIDSLWIENMN